MKIFHSTYIILLITTFIFIACNTGYKNEPVKETDTTEAKPVIREKQLTVTAADTIAGVSPDSIVSFARTLIGIPYLYASTDPAKGFDCSGFITYVFNHFDIEVPRSSVDFTHCGKDVSLEQTGPGDLILFTGTDTAARTVGHMGIVEGFSGDTLRFIHSTSGKGRGVIISAFGDHYQKRFVKVVRVFPEEYFTR